VRIEQIVQELRSRKAELQNELTGLSEALNILGQSDEETGVSTEGAHRESGKRMSERGRANISKGIRRYWREKRRAAK
jgi:hypothetical protein